MGPLRPTATPPSPGGPDEALCGVPKWGYANPDRHLRPLALVQSHAGFRGQNQPPLSHGAPHKPQLLAAGSSYRLRIGPVGTKLDGHGVEDAQLPRHLMHPPQGPLLIRVRKLHHQAGRGTLGQGRRRG